ncbi:uncharacterized protein LOC133832345 [Humulus lupulus]|uniref:uncharacterized protein LOC133832345 n=1 Tax=Humulus lupulus TaxID=3486 RepID=UPI002B412C3A|nr:uncharacterized protein LOC133832345 [Humulus lupulus]
MQMLKLLSRGEYKTNEGYQALVTAKQSVKWYKEVWNKMAIPKHMFILWLAVLDRMQLKERLFRFQIVPDENCLLCGTKKETIEHLFFDCHLCYQALNQIKDWLGWHTAASTIPKILRWVAKARMTRFRKQVYSTTVAALVYHLWWCRNEALWNHKVYRVSIVVRRIQSNVKNRVRSYMPNKIQHIDQDWFDQL